MFFVLLFLNAHKSERMFLFSIITLVSPVLRFHNITINDLIISIISVLIGIIGYKLNVYTIKKQAYLTINSDYKRSLFLSFLQLILMINDDRFYHGVTNS